MSLQTKVIGRQPTDHGPYDPNLAYGKKFQCTLFGCAWESLHDNNNTAPAVWDGGDTITPNLVDWKKVSGSYEAWLMNHDKPAASEQYPFNGMGRVRLQKNIVNGVNTLTQAMLTQQNTIYVIQYDFTLGEDITIPANCVLKFEGGSLNGEHLLNLSNTLIQSNNDNIFGCSVYGTYMGQPVEVDWFKGDDATKIMKAYSSLSNGGCLLFANRTYTLAERLTFSRDWNFTFTSKGKATIKFTDKDNCGFLFDVIMYNADNRDLNLSNLIFEGAESPIYLIDPQNYNYGTGYGIELAGFRGIIENVIFRNFYTGLSIKGATGGYFKEIYCNNCFYGCSIKTESYYNGNTFSNCRFRENVGAGLSIHNYHNEISENHFNDCLFESNSAYYDGTLTEAQKIEKETYYKITSNYGYGNGIEIKGTAISGLFFNGAYIENNITSIYTEVSALINCVFKNIKVVGGEKIHLSDFVINSSCNNVIFENIFDLTATVRPTFVFKNDTSIEISNSIVTSNYKDRTKINTNSVAIAKPAYNAYTMFPYFKNGIDYNSVSLNNRFITLFYSSSDYYGKVENGTEIYYDNTLIGVSRDRNGNSFLVEVILAVSDTPIFSNMSKFRVDGYPNISIDGIYYSTYTYGNVFGYNNGTILHIGMCNSGYIEIDGSAVPSNINYISYPDYSLSNGIAIIRCKSGSITFISGSELQLQTYMVKLSTNDYIILKYFNNKWNEIARSPSINSGTFADKPSSVYIPVGYSYLCSDRQTAEGGTDGIIIYYKGNNIWVDALGRVVS